MGIARITALQILDNPDVQCEAGGPNKDGKFSGWISTYGNDRWRPLVSTNAIYDSAEEAVAAMQEIVDNIQKMTVEEIFAEPLPLEIPEPGRDFDMNGEL